MIIGIEKTTDMRSPQCRIVKFRSEAAARKWLDEFKDAEPLAFPGAATSSIPASQQNWHHLIRTAYRMPPRFVLSAKEVAAVTERRRGSIYCRFGADAKAEVYARHAEESFRA
jgi:hypothetical protein